ncbi:MAG TPA: bifunctional alpha/beta hydrolase/OsmC family protein [Burkholderiales bacterium]
MASRAIVFASSRGHELAGRLELPAGAPRAWAIFAHCFTCSKDSKAAAYISQALAARGIAVLRFDFTGLGSSGGDFSSSTFSSNLDDLASAAEFLRNAYSAPRLLIGHSLGGAAVIAAAHRIPEARALATIGAPFEPRHVAHLVKDGMLDVGGRPFRVQEGFLADLERHDPAKALGALGKALLVMHSPRDAIVGIDHAGKIFQAARHPKSFLSLDNADHLLTRREDAAYAAEVLAAWSSRFVDRASSEVESVPGVRVVEAGEGKFAQDIYTGRHRLRADEPVSAGGADTGPSPYDLLLAGVGACTAMTIRLYAEAKKLALERVSVDLMHEKIHAADCAECETKEGRIDRIERVVTLEGALDDAQRAKLLEIAEKCPVHRTLHSEVLIPTRLAERS